ncbi:MAG: hypothetical protein K0S92_963 [Desertimonas sp.]|nr:hypothetical protein [Desertimonas sp.]
MTSPANRPPLALRALAALAGVVALLFNAMLMLSDRAPGALRRIGGDFARRLFDRIDANPADVLADPRLPESDSVVHIAVWAMAIVLVGWAVWTWIGLAIGAVAVFAASLVVEAAQGRWSDTRAVEISDVRANAVGVLVGAVVVAMCYIAYSAIAGLFRVTSRRGSPTI